MYIESLNILIYRYHILCMVHFLDGNIQIQYDGWFNAYNIYICIYIYVYIYIYICGYPIILPNGFDCFLDHFTDPHSHSTVVIVRGTPPATHGIS